MGHIAALVLLAGQLLSWAGMCAGAATSRPAATVVDSTPLAEAFETGLMARNVQMPPDGKAIVLYDLALIEDDGPGACASREYGPASPTTIRGNTQLKKILRLDRAKTRDAHLVICVAPTQQEQSPLLVNVNGRFFTVAVGQFKSSAEEWPTIRLPSGLLIEGDNSVILSCAGEKGWCITVAQRDLILRNDASRKDRPNRSFRSTDGGRTWNEGLGDDGTQAGEIMARLHLHQYAPQGGLIGPIIDLAALADRQQFAPDAQIRSVRVRIQAKLPEGTAIQLAVRSGDSPVYDPASWGDWRIISGELRSDLKRFVQWRATLSTSDPTMTPVLQAVELQADVQPRQAAWLGDLRLLDSHNEQILYTSMPFEYEKFDEPQLVELRRQYKLDDVVAGGKTELEKIIRLRNWVSAQWPYTPPLREYPAWDAREILGLRQGFCVQYAVVNMQCALSLGFQARFVFGNFPNVRIAGEATCGHEVTEVWSNDLCKWVVMDANLDECFVSRRTGKLADMLELHEDQLETYFPRGFDERGAVFDKARPSERMLLWKGAESAPRPEKPIPELKWGYVIWMPRNNFFAHRFPEPLKQGLTWSWTGYWNWEDARTPRQWRFGRYTGRRSDINWTINQVRWAATAAEQPGTIRISLGTVTPDFDTFLLSSDGAEWGSTPARLNWRLHAGKNRIEMRVRNRAGVVGPKSWIEVNYKQAMITNKPRSQGAAC